MKAIITGLVILILILFFYIGFVLNRRSQENLDKAEYWKQQAFKPDTVFSNNTMKETLRIQEIYPDSVPPKTIIIYRDTSTAGYLEFKNGALAILDSLRNTRTPVNTQFITNYPASPKLIAGTFKRDSVNLSFLNPDGSSTKGLYPVDYSNFDYQYMNNSMRAQRRVTSNSDILPKRKFIEYERTYLNYKRDLLQAEHQLEAEANLRIWNFRIGGYAQYPLNNSLAPKKLQGGIKASVGLF